MTDERVRRYERWVLGATYESSGLHFRVGNGTKKPGDLTLQVHTATGWRCVSMETSFLLADFFYENEEWLYPPGGGPRGTWIGGKKFTEGQRRAIAHGYVAATQFLEAEQRQRATWSEHPQLWAEEAL